LIKEKNPIGFSGYDFYDLNKSLLAIIIIIMETDIFFDLNFSELKMRHPKISIHYRTD